MAAGAGCTIRLGPLMKYSAARMLELVLGALSPLTKDEDSGTITTYLSCTDLVSQLDNLITVIDSAGRDSKNRGSKKSATIREYTCMKVTENSNKVRSYTLQDCINLLSSYYRGDSDLNLDGLGIRFTDILLEFKEYIRDWGGTGKRTKDLVCKTWGKLYSADAIIWLFLAKTLTRLVKAQGYIHLAARLPPVTSVTNVDVRGMLLSSWIAARLHYSSRLDLSPWPLYLIHALYASLYTPAKLEVDPRLATQLYIIVLVDSTLANMDREPVPEVAAKLREALQGVLRDRRKFNNEIARTIASLLAIYRGAARQREGVVREALRRLLEEYSHALITGLLLEDSERLAAALRIARRTSDVLYWQHASPALISAVSRLARLASMLVVYAGG